MGDGAFQMLGVNTMIDVKKYQHIWADHDPTFVVLVLNNHDLNQVTWEQRVLAGDPKVQVSQELPDFPYAQYAESLGFRGIKVTSGEDVAGAWKAALSSDRPVLLEAVTDPEYPPLPPHIRFDQVKSMMGALAAGDENRGRIIRQSIKGKLHEFTTR